MSRGVISLRGHLLFMSHRFLQSITDWTQTAAAASNCTKNPSYCCCLLPPHYAIVPGPQTAAAAQRRVSKSLCFQSQTRAAELGQQPAAWACVLTAPHSPPASSHTFTMDVMSAPCDHAPDTTAPLSGACTLLAALQHQHRFVAPVSVRAVSKCAVAGPSLGPAAWLTQLWIKVFVLLQPAGHLTGRQRGMGDSFRNKAHSLSATVVAPFIQTLVFYRGCMLVRWMVSIVYCYVAGPTPPSSRPSSGRSTRPSSTLTTPSTASCTTSWTRSARGSLIWRVSSNTHRKAAKISRWEHLTYLNIIKI